MKNNELIFGSKLVLLLAILTGMTYALAPVSPETGKIYSRAARIVSHDLPYKHLNHSIFNDDIATNALDNFINSLDFEHSYFLAADIERFRAQGTNLDDKIREGNFDIAYDIYDVLMQRVSNRVEFVKKLLENGFDTNKEEFYRWRRKDQPWPADLEEWDDLWRRKVKNQYIAKLVSEQINEEKEAEKLAQEAAEAETMSNDPENTNGIAKATLSESGATSNESNNSTETSVDIPVINAEALTLTAEATAEEPTEKDELTVTTLLPDTQVATTNEEAEAITAVPPPKKLTPEESITKDYNQYLSVLNDNDSHWLIPLYISSFVRAYDPHSDYLSQNNKEDFDINMKLSLVGIGAMLSYEEGAAKVVRLIPGGPAEQDGRLQANDKIIAVGQDDEEPVDIMHWPLSKSVRLIRGEKNTKVVLHVIPASDFSGTTVKTIDIIRDEVKLEERAAKGHVESITTPEGHSYTIGIIDIPDFYADMYSSFNSNARSLTRDVKRIISDLAASNTIDGYVLDLRNNGGGSLAEAIELTGIFIPSGPVVQVETGQYDPVVYSDVDPTIDHDGPLLILVNRQSASASEIFAGALQDYGRAIIVGDSKTHGKGTVQSLFPLRDFNPRLGNLKLTTASYYRIAGGSTQKKGVTPDIVIPSLLDSMEIGEEYLPGALEWSVIDPAIYRSTSSLKSIIPELTERSIARRTNDPRFQAYEELLNYLADQRQSKTITLKLDERLPIARRENEMADYIADASPTEDSKDEDEDEDEEGKPENDLILSESVNILVDMIILQQQKAKVPDDNAPVTDVASEVIEEQTVVAP